MVNHKKTLRKAGFESLVDELLRCRCYIRYANGAEELYDLRQDPNEWNNLARNPNPRHRAVIRQHVRWLPKSDAPPVPGSAARLLVNRDGQWFWEGKPIDPAELDQ